MTLYPIVFEPIFVPRPWGERNLEGMYGKPLPPDVLIGESWEVADRPGHESVIGNGPFAGRTLRWLMDAHGRDVLGASRPAPANRFPLLCKILDAHKRLSLQVHPPAHTGLGEPKTEMWHIVAAKPGAELFAGLRPGTTRERFEAAIHDGSVADCVHTIPVSCGDTMFLPSGRVHAIDAGLVIFEIQQNSDTTYRVYDWGHVGLDGKPRELHIEESMASIDFSDFAPGLVEGKKIDGDPPRTALVRDPLFNVDVIESSESTLVAPGRDVARVIAVARGRVLVQGGGVDVPLVAGGFCLLPASTPDARIAGEPHSAYLVVEAGS